MKLLTVSLALMFCFEATAQNYDSIRADLERDNYISGTLQQSVVPVIRKYGAKSRQVDSLNSLIARFESTSLMRTTFIIDKCGWLGKSKIGAVANQVLFLAVLYAKDKKIRVKYFPLLEQSASEGESAPADMAAMKDRILVESGQKQWYGTQRNFEGKLLPVQDPQGLNKRRAQVGLKKIKKSEVR